MSAEVYETIRHSIDDGVLTVTLSRPKRLNAFTTTMADELEDTFRSINTRDDIRAVIVTGEGRAFCAGMDLSVAGNVFGLDESKNPSLADMSDLSAPDIAQVRDPGGRVTLAIHECRKPIVAAINGAAVGIGATMTLAMDARLVSAQAQFGLVFGRLGIVPEACSSWFLPRLVGMPAALDLALSAEILHAERILDAGIASEIHEPAELLPAARKLVDRWTKGRSPVAVALTRQLLRRGAGYGNPIETHRVESLALHWTSQGDGQEGVAAFLSKREPQWQGRASELPDFYDDWLAQEGMRSTLSEKAVTQNGDER